jgi:ubiquinone/menaquinone biosynthesis C-methylase UbiE
LGIISSKTLLHVGCGSDPLPDWLDGFKETRLDIDDTYAPDIVANMMDMGEIGKYDVLFCQHALEHLHLYDVSKALNEFKRVLNDGGHLIIFVPDLTDVKPTNEVLFESPAGGITGLDLIYGFNKVSQEKPYMRHLTGFLPETLNQSLEEAGFNQVTVNRLSMFNMMGVGVK